MNTLMLQVLTGSDGDDEEIKQRLIENVKREVKQLMEEAVTKRYVHEESSSVTSLCGAVEACLSHGLKRRTLGLFKTSSTTALIQKIAKSCPEAGHINQRLLEWEIANESRIIQSKPSSSSSDSLIKPKSLSKDSCTSAHAINIVSNSSHPGTAVPKYLWIRVALYEKCLVKIINNLVENAKDYYDAIALVADIDYGSLLCSLLVGPCALDFTRTKTVEHFLTDPPADELVQRHRISCGNRTPPTCHRPLVNFKRSLHTSSEDSSSGSFKASSPSNIAKDYVESLHQNSHATLLYGKNNVLVLPKDISEPIPGYLSLHQTIQSLTIKWTPNQLMNGYTDKDTIDLNTYWAYALNINVDDIVYVHCHESNGEDTGGTIVLVGHDGVQRPPIHFPEGGHMQLFLGCLETGLLPHGQLDPPLWSHRGIGKFVHWPRNVRRRILPSVMESSNESPIDFVFRLISKSNHDDFAAIHSILDLGNMSPRRKQLSSCSTTGSSDCSSKSLSLEHSICDKPLVQSSQTASIELVCSTMRRQIISRAFYGWLAYCRHLSTVRTHLTGLVNDFITTDLGASQSCLTKDKWLELHENGVLTNETDFYRLVYFGGVSHDMRAEVWPYLLGHYSFGSTAEERGRLTVTTKHCYETTMSEWLAVEAIVQQHEKERNVKALAKMSLENKRNGTNLSDPQVDSSMQHQNILESEDQDFSDISDIVLEYDGVVTPESLIIGENTIKYIENEITEKKTSSLIKSINIDIEEASNNKVLVKDMKDVNTEPAAAVSESLLTLPDHVSELENSTNAEHSGIIVTSIKSSPSTSSYETVDNEFVDATGVVVAPLYTERYGKSAKEEEDETTEEDVRKYHSVDDVRFTKETNNQTTTHALIITEADSLTNIECIDEASEGASRKTSLISQTNEDITVVASLETACTRQTKSACVSPASSNGGVYSSEFLENFALNLHRIDKDVHRCDRNYSYFANENLFKLRNVIATYVWKHLDVGYMQGMCDLVAPLLVIFDDEALAYGCFCKLMERMIENFPNGGAMDMHFANMRSLIQILDSEMYELMDSNGDYTHFYFCYRWFLLDFKREFIYDDVFATWEVIWAAKYVASGHFVLFIALALLETYRDIILSNSMDFTDVIKFFNEMAERHNVESILQLARSLVWQLQTIIENK